MPIDPFVDIEEQYPALLMGDALLKDARGAASIQLVVVNQVPFNPVREAPNFGFIIRYCP
jgi:hypothetical protein